MKFTEHEMVFFNSITKGDTLFGIPLQFRTKAGRAETISKTIESLKKKQILKSDTELSEVGALPAMTVELYKQSSDYVIINYLHIALIDRQEAVIIIPLKNQEYELLRLPRAAILYLLLEQYPVLRGVSEKIQTKAKLLDTDSFLRKVSFCDGNIMIGAFSKNQVVSEHIYYWKEKTINRYDFNSQVEKQVDAVWIRREIVKLMQIEQEVEKYAG